MLDSQWQWPITKRKGGCGVGEGWGSCVEIFGYFGETKFWEICQVFCLIYHALHILHLFANTFCMLKMHTKFTHLEAGKPFKTFRWKRERREGTCGKGTGGVRIWNKKDQKHGWVERKVYNFFLNWIMRTLIFRIMCVYCIKVKH